MYMCTTLNHVRKGFLLHSLVSSSQEHWEQKWRNWSKGNGAGVAWGGSFKATWAAWPQRGHFMPGPASSVSKTCPASMSRGASTPGGTPRNQHSKTAVHPTQPSINWQWETQCAEWTRQKHPGAPSQHVCSQEALPQGQAEGNLKELGGWGAEPREGVSVLETKPKWWLLSTTGNNHQAWPGHLCPQWTLPLWKSIQGWEFPGSPVVRTLHFSPLSWVPSLLGELRSHKPCSIAKRKKKKKTPQG